MSLNQLKRRPWATASGRLLRRSCTLAASGAIMLAGCQQEMANQARLEKYESAAFFLDRTGSRPHVPGTIARDDTWIANVETTGKSGQKHVRSPFEVSRRQLRLGYDQYLVNCRHCHGTAGYGDGTVVQRGFPRPPSYHQERLRKAADGRIFEVITKGHGRMPAFGSLISVEDRWAIVAFVRALQLSQHAEDSELTDSDRSALSALAVEQNGP